MSKILIVSIVLLALMNATPAYAGDAARGALFAKKTCASCHAVGITGESPNPRSPPFRVIAKKYEPRDLEESLSEGIVVNHDMPMPAFELAPEDIEDLIAYLESLRK